MSWVMADRPRCGCWTEAELYWLHEDFPEERAAILALAVGETYIDSDGDTWERTE